MQNNPTDQKIVPPHMAVIYARVSSYKQTKEGNGISSQILRCKEFCERQNLSVVATFTDDITGASINRPGMSEMLAFLKATSKGTCAVVVDDISRIARDLRAHLHLTDEVEATGGVLMSPSHQFGQDATGKVMDYFKASFSELQRETNKEQTRNRQRARLMQGFWLYGAPQGYIWGKAGNDPMIIRNEPAATILAQALEDFANGLLETQEEFRRALNNNPRYPKGKSGKIYKQHISKQLRNSLYAGYYEVPSLGVPMTKALHEPLISLETFQKIQDRLVAKSRAPTRKNINEDFPLRGFVLCTCGTPYRGSWSKGMTKTYAYYCCQTKGCENYGKSIPKAQLETEFEDLLKTLRPAKPLIAIARTMFRRIWDHEVANVTERKKALQTSLKEAERDLDAMIERVMQTSQASLIEAYEKKIAELHTRKTIAAEKLSQFNAEKRDGSENFDQTYRTALQFLSNPWILWSSDRIQDKRAVLKLAFVSPLTYDRKGGYRTMDSDILSLPFKALEVAHTPNSNENSKMVRSRRLELPRVAPQRPQRCASTNSATTARLSRAALITRKEPLCEGLFLTKFTLVW